MMNLFSRNKKYRNVIEVFEKIREQGYFPDPNVIALVLNAFGKLREFENADLVYVQMQEDIGVQMAGTSELCYKLFIPRLSGLGITIWTLKYITWIRELGKALGGNSEYIYSFYFETEESGSVPPPPCLDGAKRQISNDLKLGIVESCLFVCVFGDGRKFDIWVMKDYGAKESWTKQLVIQNLYPRKSHSDVYEPVKFLGNGEILILYNDSEILCYNTGTKRLRHTRVTHTRHEFNATALTPSFVSLYHVAKES
ncbi:hypothetical protein K1719_019996 [Acacia pycnantha]|nr:hypothetical protein K1719_019996 [Acacia pycnantha]